MKTNLAFISLSPENETAPLHRQIYESIRVSILNGDFGSRMRVPSTRLLAEHLGVSRMTVVNAYDQLLAEGYLEGRIGSGTFVASRLPEEFLHTAKAPRSRSGQPNKTRKLNLSAYGKHLVKHMPELKASYSSIPAIPFQHSLTAIDEFPFEIWSKITNKCLKYSYREVSGYGDPGGYRPLRQAVGTHLRSARGVHCEDEQIIITAGAQQAVFIVAQVLLARGDTVWLEDPSHMCATDIFRARGTRTVSVPVDDEGFDHKRALNMAKAAKLAYITPSRQFPLGMTMSLRRRLNLLEWANENEAWIIEDDYDSEFRYSGRPLASLQGLDQHDRVIYVGTFSKTVFPGLRLGCTVVPPDLVDVFAAARALIDQHGPLLNQVVLAAFISEGHFERHVRRMRTVYRERQGFLMHEIDRHLKGVLEVPKTDSGMHAVGWLPKEMDDQLVSHHAQELGLRVAPVSNYSVNRLTRSGLLLGYTAFNERQIKDSVKKLERVLAEYSGSKCSPD
jgi:GntR family transcriptional regulator / MocR family aminotransferase